MYFTDYRLQTTHEQMCVYIYSAGTSIFVHMYPGTFILPVVLVYMYVTPTVKHLL